MYNSDSKSTIKLPEPSLRRLPWYLAYIKLLQTKGEEYVSSTQIAKEIGRFVENSQRPLFYQYFGENPCRL